ncbi:MAG TPA: SseB family protein, partial [Pilimelia sp.]|nr:SseB family protein [Pilimelia sp.]
MTGWDPATEAESAMRDALRGGDQELYFRILARVDLLLPVSGDGGAGRGAVAGWGTWTTAGRTHVLAFTSVEALRACLTDHTGSARRVAYRELADAWPNLQWWLAVNPGLPIEGYLPAWFVSQLARGDVRLPGRTIGARARLERVETAARARGELGGRDAPPARPALGGALPGPARSSAAEPAGSGAGGSQRDDATPAADSAAADRGAPQFAGFDREAPEQGGPGSGAREPDPAGGVRQFGGWSRGDSGPARAGRTPPIGVPRPGAPPGFGVPASMATSPDSARPDDARPDDARSGGARPDDARPDDARPDDAWSGGASRSGDDTASSPAWRHDARSDDGAWSGPTTVLGTTSGAGWPGRRSSPAPGAGGADRATDRQTGGSGGEARPGGPEDTQVLPVRRPAARPVAGPARP